ncbi:hypothetical protein BCR36DRAFT_312052, partial [Piromyces finnis]
MERLKNLIDSSNINQLKLLKFNNLKNINEIEFKNNDLLVYIIETNASKPFFEFVVKEYDNLNYELDNGKIPLFIAIENKNWSMVNILIRHKADINFCNNNGENILFYLYNNEKLDSKTLTFLLKNNINIKFKNVEGKSFIEKIIEGNNENFIKIIFNSLIFNNDFILSFIQQGKNKTCLSTQSINKMLINEKQKLKITCSMFHSAIDNRNLGILKILLAHNTNDKIFERCNKY